MTSWGGCARRSTGSSTASRSRSNANGNSTADASHELRTPLERAACRDRAGAPTQDRTAAAYRATLQRLERETHRLEQLAENLLTIARVEAGRNASEAVGAVDVAQRAAERLRVPAQARGVTVRTSGPRSVRVRSEERLLESAIVALLENALRFGRDRRRSQARRRGGVG